MYTYVIMVMVYKFTTVYTNDTCYEYVEEYLSLVC